MSVLVAAGVALAASMLGAPFLITLMRRRGYVQSVRVEWREPRAELSGSPALGGLVIALTAIVGYIAAHLAAFQGITVSGVLILAVVIGTGTIGFIDDFIKIYRQTELGLRIGARAIGIGIVGAVFAVICLHFPNTHRITAVSGNVSFVRDIGPSLNVALAVCWVLLIIFSASAGIRFADSLDGVSCSIAALFMVAYIFIAITQSKLDCSAAASAHCFTTRDPQDVAVVAAAMLGACCGFLWWNVPPARMTLGSTGSFVLGSGMAALAIVTRTELLGAVLAGLNGMILFSVIIQVSSFRLTGKRVFRAAPLQLHYELSGWSQTTIIMRFLLFEGLCIGTGLAIFYISAGLL